ncbi:transposase [Alkaliphilus peptidifermentans]|uniref:transposase n=1 Tax=Alkaliphilus peptidifermentans TaxID=426129 RepID=UPI0038BCA11A
MPWELYSSSCHLNHRIVKVENDIVTFKCKDYKDGGKQKLMSLDALEFIRRFLLHVLPPKFVKIPAASFNKVYQKLSSEFSFKREYFLLNF